MSQLVGLEGLQNDAQQQKINYVNIYVTCINGFFLNCHLFV